MTIADDSDRAFVEEIYMAYKKKIFLIANDILKNVEDAEDCLQNVIASVIDNLSLYKNAEREYRIRLLVKTTQNMAIDLYRKRKKKNFYEAEDGEETDPLTERLSDACDDVAAIVINEENKKRLTKLIMALPPIYRDVLQMKYQMGLSSSEIASLLGVSDDVIRKRLSRAKNILLKEGRDELHDIRN